MSAQSPQPDADPAARMEKFLRAVVKSTLLDPQQLKAAIDESPPAIRFIRARSSL